MINRANDVIEAAVEVIGTLDGTDGKPWSQIFEELIAGKRDAEVDALAIARLMKALLAYGALPASVGNPVTGASHGDPPRAG